MQHKWGLALVAALALLAGCGRDDDRPAATGDAAEASEPTAPPTGEELVWTGTDEAFYDPPDPLPAGEHGDLLRYQRLDDVGGAATYRVLYLSESVPGEPIAVSGLVAVPRAPGEDRPVLSWAHGTTGLADMCAPSKEPLEGRLAQLLNPFVDRNWVVVATDYEGLGTPGLHPYIAGVSEGRGTLDIIRAVKQLPDARAGDDTIIWGHSQGGHAALFAHQLAGEWTPELEVRGTVAGAPASELPLLGAALQGGDFQGYLAMVAGGLNAAYPEAELDLVLTDRGIELLDVLEEGCTDKVFEVYNGLSYDEFAKADATTTEPWKSVLEENDPGHVKVDVPLLIIHGEADQQIPPVASQLLFERLCGLGQVVERRTYPGQGHAEVIVPSFADMVTWMDARLAGTPAVSGCPTG